jgi:glutamine amidotransferase
MIAIVNYGLGNLHSVRKAVEYVGGDARVIQDAGDLSQADKIILPGVGAFKDGMQGLTSGNFDQALIEAVQRGVPLLGICLGMQLLFERSEEAGVHSGLGLISGRVLFFNQPGVKVPQIGWNQIEIQKESPLLEGLGRGEYMYFNHSYYCQPTEPDVILSCTHYGIPFISSVARDNVFGVQFHPEKSQKMGLKILENFVRLIHE